MAVRTFDAKRAVERARCRVVVVLGGSDHAAEDEKKGNSPPHDGLWACYQPAASQRGYRIASSCAVIANDRNRGDAGRRRDIGYVLCSWQAP